MSEVALATTNNEFQQEGIIGDIGATIGDIGAQLVQFGNLLGLPELVTWGDALLTVAGILEGLDRFLPFSEFEGSEELLSIMNDAQDFLAEHDIAIDGLDDFLASNDNDVDSMLVQQDLDLV